jgi:hypothetical protein
LVVIPEFRVSEISGTQSRSDPPSAGHDKHLSLARSDRTLRGQAYAS